MKKILLLFLFISSFGFSQEEDYSKLFSHFDSIQKKNIFVHLNRIVNLINYEYAKTNDYNSREILLNTLLNENGKLNLTKIDDKNSDIEILIKDVFAKIPAIEITNSKGKKYLNKYIAAKFTLHKVTDIENLKNNLFEANNDSIKSFKNLDIYPSFGKFKNNTDKEESLKNFNFKISQHIKENFKYPIYAAKNNITGTTHISFRIEKDGSVERIFAVDTHPILNYEGIEIVSKLPKLNPGYINGEPVRVVYNLPLTFKLK